MPAEYARAAAELKTQAIFCRRRHQPRRPPLAKMRPGSPAPTMGPGTETPGMEVSGLVPKKNVAAVTVVASVTPEKAVEEATPKIVQGLKFEVTEALAFGY